MRDIEFLISKERLSSYKDINEHFRNLRLVAKITPKLAIIEIALRNILDSEMSKGNADWIKTSSDPVIQNAVKSIDKKHKQNVGSSQVAQLSHYQYLSRLTLGVVIHAIKQNNQKIKMFNFKGIDFRQYDKSNKNRVSIDGKKNMHIGNFYRVDIVLNLIQNIRNRSFHWENLLKTTKKIESNGGEKIFPNITTRIEKLNVNIGVAPSNIEIFLDDVIKRLNPNLLVEAL